jgi:hypothetical protein
VKPRPIYLARPPKPVSEMTEAELDAWADEVLRAFTQANPRLPEDEDRRPGQWRQDRSRPTFLPRGQGGRGEH